MTNQRKVKEASKPDSRLAKNWRDVPETAQLPLVTIGDLFLQGSWSLARVVSTSEMLGANGGAALTAWLDQSRVGFDLRPRKSAKKPEGA